MWYYGCQFRRICAWLKLIGLVGRRPAHVLYSSDERGELSQWLCGDDSTTNTVVHYTTITIIRSTVRQNSQFLRATAGTAIARLSHRNSVCLSVCPSVTRVDQAKTVQARIIKYSPSTARKTLVS